MERSCNACGAPYEAVRASSQYCGDTCKKRAQRGYTPPATTSTGSGTATAVRAELTAAGRLDTHLGAAALALADRIDNATAVMGFAALVKELRATMEAATAGAVEAMDPVDELRARRDDKRAG